MPNTLDADRQPRRHLQPLLRLLPALLPLAGQPADRPLRPQPQRPRQRAARTAATPASPSAPPTATTSPPGCRAPATARSTSASSSTATATNRSTTAQTVPPGWSAWHTVLNADTDHYYYGYTLNDNGSIDGPFGDSGSWETREYGERDDFGCPFAPLERQTLPLRDRRLHPHRRPKSCRHPARTALLPAARLHRPARRLPPPGRARAGAAPLRLLRRRPLPAQPLAKGSTRATSTTSRASSAKRPTSRLNDIHTYRVYYQKALESLRSVDDGVQADRRHARRPAPPAQHLHHLHLRQRLLLRRAPPHRRQVPRLRALHPPALPDPRAGDQAGHADRRAGGQHRHRPDHPRTRRRRSRTRASTAARSYPSLHDTSLRTRRPILFESFVETNDVEENGGGPAAAPARVGGRQRRRAGRASTPARRRRTPRSSPRRRTTRGSASAPTSTSSGPTARKSSTTSTRTPTS